MKINTAKTIQTHNAARTLDCSSERVRQLSKELNLEPLRMRGGRGLLLFSEKDVERMRAYRAENNKPGPKTRTK